MARKEIARWDPFRELRTFRDEMDRLFDSFLFGRWPLERAELGWAPCLDVEEEADQFVVQAELPGMRKEEIKVSVTGDTLTISGERKREAEEKGKTFHRLERSYGRFSRSVTLPGEVEVDKVKAKYENGVLTLTLPKSERAISKEIPIEVK